jgi:histidinol phosphatase-like PHP family hydrolase
LKGDLQMHTQWSDGSGTIQDMTDRSLAGLGIVLGCFHSSLRRKDDQTDRYKRALRNPAIQILGHPRGRIYNFRAGLTADWPRVFGVAAELDKAVEIELGLASALLAGVNPERVLNFMTRSDLLARVTSVRHPGRAKRSA